MDTTSTSGTNSNDSGNVFRLNTFLNGTYGFYYYGTSSSSLEQGTLIDSNQFINQYYRSIQLYYQNAPHVLSNNITSNTAAVHGTSSTYHYAMYLYYCDNSLRVLKNKISTPGGTYGIYMSYCDGNLGDEGLIANNFVAEIGGFTFVYGIYTNYCTNQNIYFNNVRITSPTGNAGHAFFLLGGSNIKLANNNLVNTGGAFSLRINTPSAITYSNNNNLYGGLSSSQNFAYWNGTITNFGMWKAATYLDSNSVSMNPQFVSNSDLHVLSASMNNLGSPKGNILDDIDGDVRDLVTPDIGADEFTPNTTDASFSGVFTPTSGCSKTTQEEISLEITNLGIDTINSYNACYVIDGGTPVCEVFNQTILPNSTDTCTFVTKADLSHLGLHSLDFYTNLTGDQNHNNDSIIGHTIFNGHDFYAGDYFTSFEIGDITRGSYSYVDANNDNYYWHFWGNALNSHSGLIYMGYECDQSNTGNDWFLSRCFPFEAGKSYQVEFWYKTSNASYTQKIDVKLGNAKSVSAMTTTIVSLPTITNASFVKKTTQFTIPTTGDYYFGFYAYSPPVTTTAQIFGIIDDFKISLIPPYDAGVVEIPEPLSGCGLTLRSVKINIKNFGTANITGGLTASYRRDSSSTIITETVTNSILSGDTIEFTFSTPIDLSTTIDTAYNITAWTTLTGDTLPATIINDTFTTIVNSYTNPPPPTVFGDTVFSGQSATLIASSPYIHRWYETDTSTNIIFIGDTLLTPVLFDTTVYYVESMNGSSDLKITEVSQYHGYGTGATNPPPSYLLGDDFVEISNLGSVPANLSGYTYHREGLSSSYNITYNFPNGLILNAGEVIVLATQSSGSSNPANNFYVVANYSVSSNTATGHYLTNQQGNIVDAVALNSYSFSTASGITSSDWSGNIPSSSGNAGVVRIISDNDLASDWNISSVTAETLGSINPGISNTSQGNGCTSTKVPVTAIVNLPNIDAGVSDILQPMSLAQSGSSKSVKVIVKNYGLLAITVMDVKYTLNNGTPISYSWSGNLISGQTDTVTFPNFIIPQGAFTICSYTVLTGDQISINDTSIISSIGTQIDSLPYFDNFDTDTIWTTPTTGTTLWQIGIPNYGFTSSAHSLPNAWDINLISAYSANANAILTTQNFDFTNATNAILSFWLNYNTEVNHDGTRMEYSIDNGTNWNVLGSYNDPNGVNWYDIASISSSSLPAWAGNSSGWKKAEYNLSAFNGLPGVKFRFIFTSNSSGFYEGISIDDFEINIPNPIDAGVTNIIQPIAVLNQGVLSPVEVIIKNFGSQAITSMNIIFTLDGTANPPYPWIGNLSPNSTQNVTIANITIPAGNHNLCSYTNLIGDTINYNDTTCTVFYGNPQFDAGVTQIVNPLSTETEGTSIPVKVIIQNFGIDTITNMNIAYKLNSSSPVNTSWSGNLLPNATDTAVLSNILIPPSNNSICAYTLLTSDFNLSNDTSCKTFYGTPLLDIGAESLVYPDTGSCFTPTESVVLKIKNYGSNTINLATNPVTINANVTGVNPYTFTPVIVNTGSINSGATQNVVISSNYNMSIPGVYTFNASLSVVGDGDTTNNSIFPVSMGGVTTIATFPFMENFESGFNSMFLHKINSSSDLTVDSRASNLSNFGLHFQGGNPMGWIGAATGATANQAWNANLAHHAKAVSCNIDAANLNALRLKFDLKQTFSEGQNYSWFRVLANNNYIIEQSGDSIFNPTSSNGDPFEAKYFDLSAYIGSSFTLSFQSSNMRPDQWSSTEGDNAFVDNIILYQPDSLDIGVKSFIQPNQQHAPANTLLSVEVAIENYGYDTITSFSIGYTVAGGPPIIETWNGILYPDSTVTHLFSTQFNVISGNFNICSFTNLTHDGNPGNDTSCIAFLGIPILQLPWSDNFEGTNLWASADGYKQWVRGVPNGNTINIANSPINVWKTNLSGNYYNISDDNLYTPFFNFSNITGATLEFYHWIDSENNYDGGNVQLTKDGGISWTTLGNYADTNGTNWYSNNIGGTHCWSGSGSGWQFSSYNLDTLDNYPTPIQFRYHFFSGAVGNNYDGWAIDDFKIITPPIHKDAGVTTIISPLDSTVVGDNTNVLVTITNFGIDTLYSIPVSFQLNTQTTINETWTGTLLPDSSKNYTFTASYTALNSIYKLCAWTSLTNDIYSVNDSTCKNVGVISAPNDVGFISIIEPDSITPISILTVKATIKNFGTNTITSIPVEYKYGNNTVKETWTGTILPDSTKDYTFSTTYMSPIGSYILCARTKLVGDADSTNDKSCKNISIGINENAIDNFKLLQNVPNPTKGITNIVYIIPNAGKTKFELINLLGEIVYSQENKANAGKNQIEINVRNLPSGMYYYSLKYKGKTLSKKMIIN